MVPVFLAFISLFMAHAKAAQDPYADIEQLLSERRQANPAWVRAQSYPAFSRDDPADFFANPATSEEQRKRGADLKASVAAAIQAGKTEYTLEPGEYRMADNKGWQSPGIAFYEEYGVGGNVYRNCRIIRKPGTRRIHCGTADHFHSRTPKNGPQIIGCEAGYTSDDIINIYGAWRWLLKQVDSKTVWVASAGGVPFGDKLTFYNRGQLITIDEAEVEKVEVLGGEELAEAQAIPIPDSAIHIYSKNERSGHVFKHEGSSVFRR